MKLFLTFLLNIGIGLAGLRVGYGAFPLCIIGYLWRAKQPYNVSVAAEVSACVALLNPTYLEVLWSFILVLFLLHVWLYPRILRTKHFKIRDKLASIYLEHYFSY